MGLSLRKQVNVPRKPKTPQKEAGIQLRDMFQTPAYATNILLPFISKKIITIWEPACGEGYMVVALAEKFQVVKSDIQVGQDFLSIDIMDWIEMFDVDMIITNPPYSAKKKFYQRCIQSHLPFALLIPADYCMWTINAVRHDGCEKIIPTRRINFITPTKREGTTSYYHSLWLTYGFGLGQTETFVDLER